MSTKPPLQPNKIDREYEKEVAQRKLEPRPDEVSSASTVRHVFEESQAPPESNPDIMVGLKSDLVCFPLFPACFLSGLQSHSVDRIQ
jgi:hypothetical protein